MSTTSGGIDLHAHTTASDGTFSPTELVNLAADIGLSALAVTDHDTIAGLAEALDAARVSGIELIPGVELSIDDEAGRYHLLGYGINPHDSVLLTTLSDVRERRARRNKRIMQRSRELGLPITWDDVLRHAGDGGEVVARPHFAAALIERGVVGSIAEAFDIYLATGRPLYFPKDGLGSIEAMRLLHQAGGVGVLAHPGLSKWPKPADLEARLMDLHAEAGLDGVEVYYNKHSGEQTDAYRDVAERNGLLATGGSDFHGDAKPDVALGDVYRGLPAPLSLLQSLHETIARTRSTTGASS
ncbi:MAG: PHP domain-containing protein [Capsulimonadaceae bacterium]|nr:PHP domain-containing protein [Capsulimonadaceae bacterium]